MDVLELMVTRHSWRGDSAAPAVAVMINGERLSDIVLRAMPAVLGPAATDWTTDLHPLGLWPSLLRRWVDLAEDPDAGRWVPVLVCACGEFPCGGFAARMTLNGGTVVWHNFIDASSYAVGLWDDVSYSRARVLAAATIGPFRFKEADYRRQVNALLSQC
jgi:hypothetical protein